MYFYTDSFSGPGSVVGIATAYGLDGSGIESGDSEIFRICPDRPWGSPSLLYNGYWIFPGGKLQQGGDADPSPPSNAEVKNRVELYLYSP
jgi:8-oxo-dGTP pyrophosphatase MutT (NUDIX family)